MSSWFISFDCRSYLRSRFAILGARTLIVNPLPVIKFIRCILILILEHCLFLDGANQVFIHVVAVTFTIDVSVLSPSIEKPMCSIG